MNNIRKAPKEKEIIEMVRRNKIVLLPLSFCFIPRESNRSNISGYDLLVEVSHGSKRVKFAVKCQSLTTPKAFQYALNNIKMSSLPDNLLPLLIVPYLSENQLIELERDKISGVDLCGNGVVTARDNFFVFRGGNKNLFTSSAPIKNIYRKRSSMVGRVFLAQPEYRAVQDIRAEIQKRTPFKDFSNKGAINLSTVSKALKTLEEELIIARGDTIRLIQPDLLLQKLRDNFTFPETLSCHRLKVDGTVDTVINLLRNLSTDIPFVTSGRSSVERYAVMQRADILSIYTPQPEFILKNISGNPSDRFWNLEILESEDETVYFDSRERDNFFWASPVQVYLELMAGDKRDRDTADQLRSYILKEIEGTNNEYHN